MGASRVAILRQYLAESVTLALGSGLLGLGLASIGVKGLLRLAPAELPAILGIGIDGSVLAFTVIISVVAGMLFGIFPIFGHARRDLAGTLKDGGRAATAGRDRHRARSGLVVAQVALALVLLVGSGLMFRSFAALSNVDPGFEADGVVTFRYALPRAEYQDPQMVLDFHRRLTDQLAAIPDVVSAGMISGVPLTGQRNASPMEPVDQPLPEGELGPIIEWRQISPGFFETAGVTIQEGRALQWDDQVDQIPSVVVSAALAAAFWPGESAVGRQIRNQGAEHAWQVVGVADNVRFDDMQDEAKSVVYFPVLFGSPDEIGVSRSLDAVVRVNGDPLAAIAATREALRAVDPRIPMINPRTMQDVVDVSMAATSFTVLLLGIAAGIALLLGTVGIYGVISFIVSRRTQEIGVRMALGAPANTVLRNVVGQGMVLTGWGIGIGILGAWGLSRALSSLLYGVSATDPLTFGGTALLLCAISLLATWIPARRASRVNPVEALRAE
jgi:predicted permease